MFFAIEKNRDSGLGVVLLLGLTLFLGILLGPLFQVALGLKNGAKPHASIESMAAHYVRLLKKFQPRGPYYLGGWCFGGIVAVEMAQQLQEAGDEVAALLLMETISVSPGAGSSPCPPTALATTGRPAASASSVAIDSPS